MKREEVQHLLNEGFDILQDGDPVVVPGDLWNFLDGLSEDHPGIYVLEDLIKLPDAELARIHYNGQAF